MFGASSVVGGAVGGGGGAASLQLLNASGSRLALSRAPYVLHGIKRND